MKGQKLFVKIPADEGDRMEIDSFYDSWVTPAGGTDAVARIAGALVAHAVLRTDEGTAEIVHLYVTPEMRHKRVGRIFLREIDRQIGHGAGRSLTASATCPISDFLADAGFILQNGVLRISSPV